MEIIASDFYSTEGSKISPIAKISSGFYFYTRLMKLVFSASKKAKKGIYDKKEWEKSSFTFLDILESTGVNVNIDGIDNFRYIEEPVAFIGNHMSTLETFLMPCIVSPYKDVTFIVKKSLVDYPVFKHVMRSRNPVVVGRNNPREDLKIVLTEGAERIRNGYSLIIFPQTTRSNVFDTNQFNSIGVKLAAKTDSKIVPVALKTDAWANGVKFKDFGKIYPKRDVFISFGEPIDTSVKNKTEIHREVQHYIVRKLKSWNCEVISE